MGCDRAESPAEVRDDVSDARKEAAEQVADARGAAAEKTAEVRRDIAGETKDVRAAQNEGAEKLNDANLDLAMARIEGERKISTERCEALAGDAQSECKSSADATYETAKAQAERFFE